MSGSRSGSAPIDNLPYGFALYMTAGAVVLQWRFVDNLSRWPWRTTWWTGRVRLVDRE